MKTSISTFSHFYYSLEDCIRRVGQLGFDAVEIWGGTPHGYAYDMDEAKIAAVRSVLQETGLAVSGFIPAQFRYPTNIAIDDELVRRRSLDYLKKSIEVAAALGSPLVSICPGHSRFGQDRRQAWENMLQALSELADYAPKAIRLMLEPGNHYETDLVVTAEDGRRAIREAGRDIGLVLDTGHLFINRESVSDCVLEADLSRCHFHIDDNLGITDDHSVPGTGKIDFSMFFANLKRRSYDGYLTVELGFQYCTDPDPAALKSLLFIRSNSL
ncbi:MAG: sugar phosphate isomerase/epimerase [Negativicutes bacterium]|nr:sugar phosphate isomerase/epimerase [Negativicutes bacterium]